MTRPALDEAPEAASRRPARPWDASIADLNDTRRPGPMDLWVGARVRERRLFLGWSVERLAKEMGLSRQQIEKCEKGATRLAAQRIFDAAVAMDVKPGWFFEGMPLAPSIEDDGSAVDEVLSAAGIAHLRLYNRLTTEHQGTIRALMEQLAAGVPVEEGASGEE